MQSTQAQMRRRERKRLKREEKRRSLPAGAAHRSLTKPELSDSFQEFVRPLIDGFPARFEIAKLREPLVFASAVWNAVIAARGDIDRAVADVCAMMAELQQQPVSAALETVFEALAARKLMSFADDDRIVADVEVRRTGADVRVLAHAVGRSSAPWQGSREG